MLFNGEYVDIQGGDVIQIDTRSWTLAVRRNNQFLHFRSGDNKVALLGIGEKYVFLIPILAQLLDYRVSRTEVNEHIVEYTLHQIHNM